MPLRLTNGPPKLVGVTLSPRRAPKWLRVTLDRTTGEIDCLDQLDDQVKPVEDIFVYKMSSNLGGAFIDFRDGKGRDGWYPDAEYSYYEVPTLGLQLLRDNDAWRRWVQNHEPDVEIDPATGAARDVS